jgi:lactoylglutathione lyase
MTATGINHVTIVCHDVDESTRFYTDLFDAEEVASPNFGVTVIWLRVGDVQIHLLNVEEPTGGPGHFGLTVDDFPSVYERAQAMGIFAPGANDYHFWQLPDGVAQLYVRDPSGNLVEIDSPGAESLPDWIRADIRVLAELLPQDERNLGAQLLAGEPAPSH